MPDEDHFDVETAKAVVRQMMEKERGARERWGAQGPPINIVWNGQRLVSSFNELLAIEPTATYHEFLEAYIQQLLGERWWEDQASRPRSQRHQLVYWQSETARFRRRLSKGTQRPVAVPMPGSTAHYLRLAYNLHQIRHLGLLQNSLLKRLRVPEQFQGAFYEVEVCAAFARADFAIAMEPEGKDALRRCEFVATHAKSEKSYSVEAKSRHVHGALGHVSKKVSRGTEEPNISRLIRKALKKDAAHDRVICIDVNVAQRRGTVPQDTWVPVVREQISALGAEGLGPALVICTNAPFHYQPAELPATGQAAAIMPLREPRFQSDRAATDREFPGLIGTISGFTRGTPGTWD